MGPGWHSSTISIKHFSTWHGINEGNSNESSHLVFATGLFHSIDGRLTHFHLFFLADLSTWEILTDFKSMQLSNHPADSKIVSLYHWVAVHPLGLQGLTFFETGNLEVWFEVSRLSMLNHLLAVQIIQDNILTSCKI